MTIYHAIVAPVVEWLEQKSRHEIEYSENDTFHLLWSDPLPEWFDMLCQNVDRIADEVATAHFNNNLSYLWEVVESEFKFKRLLARQAGQMFEVKVMVRSQNYAKRQYEPHPDETDSEIESESDSE